MARTAPSHATPAVLVWAREKAGLSVEDVAAKEKVDPEVLAGWEDGDGTPSLAKLRDLAQRYKRPLALFYLEEAPVGLGFNVPNEYRLVPGGRVDEGTSATIAALRELVFRKDWAADYFARHGYDPVSFVGSVRVGAGVSVVTDQVRNLLKLATPEDLAGLDDRQVFNVYRERIESVGVFVFQIPRLDVEQIRGVAWPDRFAPAIGINTKDAVTARTFSLIHEFTHLLLGKPVLWAEDRQPTGPDLKVERLCNRVAAEVLVPADDFRALVPKGWRSNEAEAIKRLARRYGVSRLVVLGRLVELGLAEEADYVRLRRIFDRPPAERRNSAGGPPRAVLVVSRTGKAFSRLALQAFRSGEITGGHLAELIGSKLNHLPKIEKLLYENKISTSPPA